LEYSLPFNILFGIASSSILSTYVCWTIHINDTTACILEQWFWEEIKMTGEMNICYICPPYNNINRQTQNITILVAHHMVWGKISIICCWILYTSSLKCNNKYPNPLDNNIIGLIQELYKKLKNWHFRHRELHCDHGEFNILCKAYNTVFFMNCWERDVSYQDFKML
jgi:hypothetical protein